MFCIDVSLQAIGGQTLPFTQRTGQVGFFEHTVEN